MVLVEGDMGLKSPLVSVIMAVYNVARKDILDAAIESIVNQIIMEPTEGRVTREGTIAALLEFGSDVQGICDRYQEFLDGKRKL